MRNNGWAADSDQQSFKRREMRFSILILFYSFQLLFVSLSLLITLLRAY
jgi:hypothetical protein